MVLIGKDKKALGFRCTQRAKPLIDALVSVFDLVQHHAHDDDIRDRLVLQEVHL